MNVKKIINIKHPISLLKYFDGKVGIIDKKNTFRMYDCESLELVGGFKIKLPENNPLENSVDISPYGNYLSIAVRGKNKTTIWDINKKKLIHTLGWHRGEVLSVSFDFDENYLLTGGMDGRVYLWSVAYGKMVSSLPPHPDYVLSTAFSKNSLWAASGSYDKMVSITNISSMNINYKKKSHRGAVTKIKFLKSQRMISGDKSGEIIIWDYTKGKIVSRLHGLSDVVIDLEVDENEEYLFAITNEKKVYLFDLKNYELITDSFIKLGELPSSLVYISENQNLWVGTLNGSIYIYDIFEDNKKLKQYVITNEFGKAYELVKANPFLKRTDEYKQIEKKWEKSVDNAYKLMEKGEYERAKQILKPFLEVPHKRTFIQNMLSDFADFEKFKTAVMKLKYPLAYSLAEIHPSFKETVYYKKMENDFKKVFAKAKELIKLKGQLEKVKELLKPFRGVPQKTPLIQSLFNDKQLYDLLKNYLMEKKFEEFFKLVERNPFLYESAEYEMAMKYAEKLYNLINDFFKKGDYKHVIQYANMLKHFPKYKELAEDFIKKAEILSRFLNVLASENVDLIEKMVLDYAFLEDLEDYKDFKRKIREKFLQAEKFSSKGDVKNILKVLGNLVNSKIYENKIINLIKSAYLNQLLDVLIKKEKEKLSKGINNYISLFGLDNEIEDILKMAKRMSFEIKLNSTDKSRLFDFNSLPDFIWEEF